MADVGRLGPRGIHGRKLPVVANTLEVITPMSKLFNCCGLWGTGRTFANAIAVGIGGGVGFGALIDNMGTGIAVGAAIAVAVSVAQVRKKES